MTRAFALTCFAVAFCVGCAGASAEPRLPVRILSSEAASAPRPEAAPSNAAPSLDANSASPSDATAPRNVTAPRIGAPGGSGAGSRRVAPIQSGNETVGGLPAGMAGGVGAGGFG